jgi:hypothetical protein
LTVIAQVPFSRLAKARENSGGMCWAIAIPGQDGGNWRNTKAMASVLQDLADRGGIVNHQNL